MTKTAKLEVENSAQTSLGIYPIKHCAIALNPTHAEHISAHAMAAVSYFPTYNHRDRTRVQMPAKIFPHLKVKC